MRNGLRSISRRVGKLVCNRSPYPLFRLSDVAILSDPYGTALSDSFTSALSSDAPFYVSRLGGVEYEAASAYFANPTRFRSRSEHGKHLRRAMELAGYFDVEHRYDRFERFIKRQIQAYERADALTYANPDLVTKCRRNSFERHDLPLLNHVCESKQLFDYEFIEATRPFLNSFRVWGDGRKVLVVSPLSKSVQHQYQRLDQLISGYTFPSFELVTHTSPVTWSTPDDTMATLKVSTTNWHEELEIMLDGISKLDFDVALISCGSYAASVGDFIRHDMQRSAVYLGGILNVMFNIYGMRYDTPFFNAIMRREAQINAFENVDVAHLRGGRSFRNEAMRAYFGEKPLNSVA